MYAHALEKGFDLHTRITHMLYITSEPCCIDGQAHTTTVDWTIAIMHFNLR